MINVILGETYMNIRNFFYYAYYEIKYTIEECTKHNCYMEKHVNYIHSISTSKSTLKSTNTNYYDDSWEKV